MSSNFKYISDLPQPPESVLNWPKVTACILFIVQIAIGSVYLNECPRQPYIPIYLIVGGVFGLMLAILICVPCAKKIHCPPNWVKPICIGICTWNTLTLLFFFAWFITGNVWIYSIYQPNYNKNTTDIDPYCNKTLYLFSFWTTTLLYILVGTGLAYIGYILIKVSDDSHTTVEPL